MSRRFLSGILPALAIVLGAALLVASHDALAKRLGGGGSIGRQSSGVMQRQATPPASAPRQSTPPSQASAIPAAGAAAGAATARSGMSRWLGPVAGIAAGLGLAALFSHLGMGGAMAEMLGSLLLIGVVIMAVLFLVRRLRGGGSPQPAFQAAGNDRFQTRDDSAPIARETVFQTPVAVPSALDAPPAPFHTASGQWAIPADFDTANFLRNCKANFVKLQGVWDSGDLNAMRELVTDDLLAELGPQLRQRDQPNVTEVVLLNAELLGIETVSDGYLASVRFSGMLREAVGAEAFRFEEVWNLFKPHEGGWLLAGVQQIPVQQ
jgi:predicted lipid-binding transport protein (Tim44 family)